ncbi:YndJ family protein [Dactylosporangium sp. AC04546]|uniref:YndJ family protein n=1 Tax=Dactylosporangium sp. AC04546 TaxID=2862460 RepID=UPI001EDE9461|nr:YndJ family protein [Dactylosporangium sp. AC04546]WVK88115.1 YndJ family protein [Dactylosporangium sp. AC04546]
MLLNALLCLGMLVVVPLGLDLVDRPWPWHRRALWLLGAGLGALSLWLPRGWPAAALATAYLLATLWLAGAIPGRLWALRIPPPREIAVLTALASPAVAASALVAERAGYRLFGFRVEILSLTVAHFHYAGFVAALVAGLVCRLSGETLAGRAAALSVPGGIGLVFLGYFTNDWVELAGAVVLTAGMWLTGWLTVRLRRDADRTTRALLVTSAVVLVATMVLAVDWALGRATGLPHLSLSWMVATHGLGNALGFALCGVLAWRRFVLAPGQAAGMRRDRQAAGELRRREPEA